MSVATQLRNYNVLEMDLNQIISSSYLAAGFTPEFTAKVAAISEFREYAEGEFIVQEEDSTADLMILADGIAHILTMAGDVIGIIRPNMPFGEVAFLDRKRRSSTVIARSSCKVVFIPEDPLRELLRLEPEMAVRALVNLSSLLCDRLRKANQQIAALNAIEEFHA